MMHVYGLMAVMALVTYLIRMAPFVAFRRQIQSRFLRSFLYYIPYAVLSAMTIPAIFSSTASLISAVAGFCVAVLLAFRGKSLLTVAIAACATSYLAEMLAGLL